MPMTYYIWSRPHVRPSLVFAQAKSKHSGGAGLGLWKDGIKKATSNSEQTTSIVGDGWETKPPLDKPIKALAWWQTWLLRGQTHGVYKGGKTDVGAWVFVSTEQGPADWSCFCIPFLPLPLHYRANKIAQVWRTIVILSLPLSSMPLYSWESYFISQRNLVSSCVRW